MLPFTDKKQWSPALVTIATSNRQKLIIASSGCVDCSFQISLKNDILGTKTNGNKYAYTRIIHIWPSMCAPVRVLGGGNSYLNSVLVLWLLVLLESCCVWCSFVTSGEELWLPIQQHFILTSTWLLNCRIT